MPSFGGGGGTLGSTVEVAEMESLAKGSFIVGDGSGPPRELLAGANGTVLVADSAADAGQTARALTKTDVGLASVDNTSDAGKPVSTAQQTALDLKANIASPTFTGTVAGITAAMVGAPSGSGTSSGTNTGDAPNHAYSIQSVTATGSTQGDAAALTASKVNVITNADNAVGVKLPAAAAGVWCLVSNMSSGFNNLKVWPSSGDNIKIGMDSGVNNSMTAFNNATTLFFAIDDTTWNGFA